VKVIDTIPTTKVTIPSFLVSKGPAVNGKLDTSWLRKAAGNEGIVFRTSGDYRPYTDQVLLFTTRYTTQVLAGRPRKFWQGQWWYQKPGTAMAATPGTSNHGLGLANDFAQEYDGDPQADPIIDPGLLFLRDHPDFGFGLETRAEPWHWHWRHQDRLSQLVVDTLFTAGIAIPDLQRFGFTVPDPTPDQGEWIMVPRNERILDTRDAKWGVPRFNVNTAQRIKVPYGATQAMVKLVAVNTSAAGFFTVGGVQKPNTSACNFGLGGGVQGQSLCYTGVDPDGTFQVWCDGGASDLIIDLQGTG
jgi:hypothetical protein